MEHTGRPRARSADLITEELGRELLVYDERVDRGHCLSADATRVWLRCDGRTPADGIAAQVNLDLDTVKRALAELDACDLLDAPPGPDGSTRRELSVKLVRAGGVAALTPLIFSVMAPHATAGQTNNCGGIGSCLCNCGQTVNGCQGSTCECCQLNDLTAAQCGNGCTQSQNVKRCVAAGNPCPDKNSPECCVFGTGCNTPAGC